jgi:hypothetical protein
MKFILNPIKNGHNDWSTQYEGNAEYEIDLTSFGGPKLYHQSDMGIKIIQCDDFEIPSEIEGKLWALNRQKGNNFTIFTFFNEILKEQENEAKEKILEINIRICGPRPAFSLGIKVI